MKPRVKIIWLKESKAAYQPMNYEGQKYLKSFLKLTDLPHLLSFYWL